MRLTSAHFEFLVLVRIASRHGEVVVQQGNVTFLISEKCSQKLAQQDLELNHGKPGQFGDQSGGEPGAGGDDSEAGDELRNKEPAPQQPGGGGEAYPWLAPLCNLPVDTLFNVCLEVNDSMMVILLLIQIQVSNVGKTSNAMVSAGSSLLLPTQFISSKEVAAWPQLGF